MTEYDPELKYLKQFTPNACGSIAYLHVVLNSLKKVKINKNSFLENFTAETKNMNAQDAGKFLDGSNDFQKLHKTGSNIHDNSNIGDSDVNHFVAYTNVNSKTYLLDGRAKGPVSVEECPESSFLNSALKHLSANINRDKPVSALIMFAKQ